MPVEQKSLVADRQSASVLARYSSGFRAGLFIVLMAFFPIFLSNKGSFLPSYFTNGFYLALLVAAGGALLAGLSALRGKSAWKFTRLDLAIGLFALYFIVRFAFSPYAHWSQGRFIWWLALFVLYGVFRVFFSRIPYRGGVWSGLMLVALAQIIIGQLQLMDILPAQHSLFKISGSFFNPAPYGGFLAVLFPLALYEAVKKEGARPAWQKYLAWLVVAGALLVILPAQSRAAWLALVAGSAWVLVDRFRLPARLRQWPKPSLVVTAALLVSLSAFGAYWLYQFKADSASGRLLVWKVSAGMWLEKPLFGHDPTRFAPEYMAAQADYFAGGHGSAQEELLAGNIPFAYNEFLQIAVESGVVGLSLFLAILVIALRVKRATVPNVEEPSLAPIKASLLSWLVFACFSYPMDVWGLALLFVFLLACLTKTPRNALNEKVSRRPAISNGMLGAGFLFFCFLFLIWTWRAIPAARQWKKGLEAYRLGHYDDARQKYAGAFDFMQYEGPYLQHAGKCLAQLGDHEGSNNLLQLAKDYYKDPILYTTMGNNYIQMGDYKNAENAFLIAQNMVPHRIHPSYLLAQMYYAGGRREKAARLATILLEKRVKIRSQATEEMMNELRVLSAIDY